MPRLLPTALILALAAALLAACGGGEETTAELTRAEIIKRADAICKEVDDQQLELLTAANEEKPVDQRSDGEREEIILTRGLAPVKREAAAIAALAEQAPEPDRAQLERIVAEMNKAIAKAEADALGFIEEYFERVDRLSADYGFKVCSEAL